MDRDGSRTAPNVTTGEEFADAVGAVVQSAVENGVEVRGSWLVEEATGGRYDVEIVAVEPRAGTVADAVVDAVATHEGVDPTALPPLAEAVEPGALDAVTAPDGDRRRLSFEYHGYAVTVHADGSVSLGE
jgi:hypothetical protein